MSESLGPKPDTHGYYDAFAASGQYDKDAEFAGWPAALDLLVARIFEFKPPKSVQSVLELGVGTGLAVTALKKFAQPERVVAVDESAEMLKLFSAKSAAHGVELQQDSIQNYVENCRQKFDLIVSFSTLEFLPNLPRTLQHGAGLLKKGGAWAFTYAPRRSEGEPSEQLIDSTPTLGKAAMEYRWTPAEVAAPLHNADLTVVDWLDDATPTVMGCDYTFVVAQKLRA